MLHLAQLVLPLPGHGRARQLLGLHRGQKLQELLGLGCRDQFPLRALDVLRVDEAVDRVGAGRRGSQAAFLHRLGQLVIVDQFAGRFHGGQERRLRVARGRACGLGVDDRVGDLGLRGIAVVLVQGGQRLGVLGVVLDRGLAVHPEPAGEGEDLALGLEGVVGDHREAGRDVELRGWVEGGDKPPGNHVEDLSLHVLEVLRLVDRGDDGKVIGNLRVVEDALVGLEPALVEHLLGMRAQVAAEVVEGFPAGGDVVLGQGPRVGSRVGDHLVLLVEGLRDLGGAARGQAEAVVRLALEGGEVVEAGCRRGARLLLVGDLGGTAGLAVGKDGLRLGLVPDAVHPVMLVLALLEAGALVHSLVLAPGDPEGGGDAPEVAGLEVADLQLAGVHDREGGGLHAADRGDVAGPGAEHALGEGARPVDADQPVALAAAAGGVGKALHLLAVPQVPEGLLDAGRGHGLHPGALHRQLALGELVDVREDKFALAPGVAGIDDLVEVLAGQELLQVVEALLGGLDGLQLELLGNDRQHLQPPEAILLLVNVLGHQQLDQVADR